MITVMTTFHITGLSTSLFTGGLQCQLQLAGSRLMMGGNGGCTTPTGERRHHVADTLSYSGDPLIMS